MFLINFNHPESLFYENYRRQLLATLTVNVLALSHGIGLGWVAPMLLTLQSSDSPLTFHVSVEEASSIGAFVSVGGLIGNFSFGVLLDLIGRKKCLYLLAVPHICFWCMVFFANDVYYLYIARVLGGTTGGGTYVVLPIFVAEIADSRVRGTLASGFGFALSIGMLLGNIIGSHISYLLIPCLVMVLPVIYLILVVQFPETPQYLLRNGYNDAAEKSLKYYRNIKGHTKDEVLQFEANFNELKSCITSSTNKQKASFKDLCNPTSVKALLIGIVLMFVFGFSGIYALISYSSLIFAEAKSSLDPKTNTIIIGVFQIIGSYCAFIMIDRYGRKFLMTMSTAGMCIGFTIIGVYSYMGSKIELTNVTWLPVVLMSMIILSANIGVISVTFIVLVEILPTKIRSFGTTFCLVLSSLFTTIVVKAFPVLMVSAGLAVVMWIFATATAFGFIFFLIFLKETKGKNLDTESS
ncbi:facilitated trehalose transporter Tret1-like [Eupeodes corollae]|uniref:facilitated trehalose transporter Tret1-like n=1 Tax=Eupeodes corollae TaxID=290404 RepID=UPI00248FFAB9|nr:facilitated trehalose transporter Tret1-like [Eupeodes corollae]